MNSKELMTNYLSLLKSNVEVYIHGTIESSNKKVKNCLKNSLNNTLDSQEKTFNIMVNENMYQVSNIKPSDINKTYKKVYSK